MSVALQSCPRHGAPGTELADDQRRRFVGRRDARADAIWSRAATATSTTTATGATVPIGSPDGAGAWEGEAIGDAVADGSALADADGGALLGDSVIAAVGGSVSPEASGTTAVV